MNIAKIRKCFFLLSLSSMLFMMPYFSFTQTKKTKEYENKIQINYKKYGKAFVSNIPKGESAEELFACLTEISTLYKSIQGCTFNNPAIFNGMTAEEIMHKVIYPARKLFYGQKFGAYQDTLFLMVYENSTDSTDAFISDMENNVYNSYTSKLDGLKFQFDETFFGHYDNIILLQPNSRKTADQTLDTMFSKLIKCLEKGSRLDIVSIGHGADGEGVWLSSRSHYERDAMDISDFDFGKYGVSGNQYARDMLSIFKDVIDSGYNPKVIGIGCSSDFLQKAIDKMMPEEYRNSVKIFGTPYNTYSKTVIGYVEDHLEFITHVAALENSTIGLIIELTDIDAKLDNDIEVESFLIDVKDQENFYSSIILKRYHEDDVTQGSFSKPSGVIMQYVIND